MDPAWTNILPSFLRSRILGRETLRAILGNTSWLLADRMLRLSVGALVSIWMARHLGPERLGLLMYALALVGLMVPLSQLGLNGIVVRDLVHDADRKEETLGTVFLLKVLGGLLSMVVLLGLVWYTQPDDVATKLIITVVSSTLLFRASDTIDLWFQSQVASKNTAYVNGVVLVLGAGLKIGLILANAPLIAFAYAVAAEAAACATGLALLFLYRGQSLAAWRPRLARAVHLLRQSWPLILSGFGAIIYLKIDQVMLREFGGEQAVGIYSVAVTLSELWYFVPAALASSAFPALLKSRTDDPVQYRKRLQKLYNALALAALAVALPTTFLGEPVVALLFGEPFRAAGPILGIHIWAGLFIFMRAALSKWLIAEGLFRFSIVTHVCGALVNVGANLLLIPSYGGIGAALATVLSYATASYLSLFLHKKTWPAAAMMTHALLAPARLIAHNMPSRASFFGKAP